MILFLTFFLPDTIVCSEVKVEIVYHQCMFVINCISLAHAMVMCHSGGCCIMI